MAIGVAAVAPKQIERSLPDGSRWLLVLVWSFTLPFAGLLALTAFQLRPSRGSRPTFAPHALTLASLAMSADVLAMSVHAYAGVFAGVVLVPAASASLSVAWCRPRPGDLGATTALGAGLAPLVVWCAGRADEVVLEAVVSSLGIGPSQFWCSSRRSASTRSDIYRIWVEPR